jgi:AGZA family xanthine/uracil permease-like MFS transporter
MNAEARSPWTIEGPAGVTTFLTMAYIVIVNPAILASPGTGMSFPAVLTATVVLAASMTLLMGFYADLPFGVAPGMGLNAFFAFSIVLGQKVPWQTALGMVFWAGVLFTAVSLTPLRVQVARAIPENLRTGAAAGIGVFLTFIGLKNMGLIVADPATFVRMGTLDAKAVVAFVSLALTVALMRRKSPFAFLAGMALATAVALAAGWVKAPERWLSMPDFSAFGALDIKGALAPSLAPAVISILFTDLFDSISTFVGVSKASGLVDEKGEPRRLKEGLVVDAFATLGAGIAGTSSGTAYIESAAGIEAGGRSGRTAIVTGLCFLPCLFLAPVAALVPACATGPVLVLVGALMFRSVRHLKLELLEDVIPAFLTIVLIPLTFSITQGLLWGFIAHAALHALVGRAKELPWPSWALAALSLGLLALEHGAWK